jgi:hypothetical protein
MIVDLPYTLEVDGVEREINTDFRDIINIFIALNDNELSPQDKTIVMLNNLYKCDIEELQNIQEAIDKASWFMDWGKEYKEKENAPKLMDWEQDYNMIIAAVNNKVKTVEDVRELPHLHWWTFLGYFSERGKCQLSQVMELREKIAKGEKLEKWEKQMLRDNQDIIILHDKNDDEFEQELWGD